MAARKNKTKRGGRMVADKKYKETRGRKKGSTKLDTALFESYKVVFETAISQTQIQLETLAEKFESFVKASGPALVLAGFQKTYVTAPQPVASAPRAPVPESLVTPADDMGTPMPFVADENGGIDAEFRADSVRQNGVAEPEESFSS